MMLWGDKKLHKQGNENFANGVYANLETLAKYKQYVLIPLLIFFLFILLLAVNTQGLVAYWKFDENTGTKAEDSSNYGNNGTISGATWTQGKIGSALQFDGVNDYVEGPDSPSLDVADKITLMAWTKINAIDTKPHSIVGKVSGYDFAVRGSNLRFEIIPNDIDSTGINLVANTWYHVAVTYDRSNVIFYKNGVEMFRTAKSTPLPNGSVFRIGRNQWNEYFNGVIDDVKIYNRALSTNEIYAEYLSGTIDTTLPAVSSTDPQNNAVNVMPDKNITVTFSESIQAGADYNNISLKDSNGNAVSATNIISGSMLTIDPVSDLGYSTTYTVTIPAGAIKDMSNNNLASPYSFSFITSALVQPVLTSIIISPSPATVTKGSTQQFTASPKDQFGNPYSATPTWTSSNTTAGTISSSGMFTALEYGTTIITASSGSISNTSLTTVTSQIIQQIVTFASNGISEPFNFINHPHAAYYNGRTYVVWQGANLDPYITYYDHNTKSWGTNTRVAHNPLSADSHGAPSIVIDNSGYIHVFYGSHGSNQKHAKSNSPENIGSFTVQPDIVGSYTYPNPIRVGNSIYLFLRAPTAWTYRIYDGNSWSTENTMISMGLYLGFLELNNNKIHMTWTNNNGVAVTRQNVYYAYMDLSDPYNPHHLYSIDGRDLGTTIDATEANTYAMVRNTGASQSNAPSLHVDSNGYPWIFYIEGNGTSWQFYHTRWTGSAWTAPVAITTTDDQWNYIDFIINSGSDVTAYLTSTGGAGQGGDIEEWHWNGNAWSKVQTILSQSASGKPLDNPLVPFNFNSELKLFFSQYLDENFVDNTLKLYAYFGTASDTTPPAVSLTDPPDNAVNVTPAKTITVTFSEGIQAGTDYNSISLKDSNSNAVSTTNSISGSVLTIDPVSGLGYSTAYTVSIPAGAVKDLSNNNLANPYSFSFTTSAQSVLTTITVSPSSVSVAKGSTQTFIASPKDQFGNPVAAAVIWTSSNTSVGTINSGGLFTAISAGTTTITAASGIVNGTATATVLTQPPGLVAYWNFNEGSGAIASDSSGSGNTGAIYRATWTTGKIASALQFSGANQYVRGNKIVNIPKATVEAWVYITSAPASSKLIAGFVNGLGSTREDKLLHITSGRRIGFTVWDGISDKTIISTSQIPLNTWTHVAGTADGTNARVYVNGVEAGSIAAGNTEADYTVPDIFIGGSSASFGYFSGKIDEVKIYNRSLSASEITDEYLQGT